MPRMDEDKQREECARALAAAERVAVMTGAGISADSGVPTFRGAGGLWQGHRPEELATPEAFARDPRLVWEFYDWRRTALAECVPNPGHGALAELERLVPVFTLITQNVDGLHRVAGSSRPLELHGSIWDLRCVAGCGGAEDRRAPMDRPLPPRCACGEPLRPCVVWFGEMLPWKTFEEAGAAAEAADVFLVVGTSGVVEPAASLARVAQAAGARVAEVNPEPSALSAIAEWTFRASASAALPPLVERVRELR